MGTPEIPDSKPYSAQGHVDRPRVGASMWALLACFLIPPTLVTFLGNQIGGLPHQNWWVIGLGLPLPVLFLSMPRRYVVEGGVLTIQGLYYRLHVPLSEIRSIEPISSSRAMFHLSSFLCSDPGRALRIRRSQGMDLVFSPRDPEPFLAALARIQASGARAGNDAP